MISVGIDPGINGAFAVLADGVFVCAERLPTFQVSKSKSELDAYGLIRLFYEKIPQADISDPLRQPVFYLERVASMPKQGVASSFNFGCAFGMIRGVLAGSGQRVHLITPAQWKKKAKLIGQPKDVARIRAQHLYPKADLRLKKDVDKADAILLAHFGPDCVS